MRLHPPIGGPELDAAIDATPEIRPALINELVLKESVVMVAAAPASGKTTLISTMLFHGSMGLPVFYELATPRPLNLYVFCPERKCTELKERCKKIKRFNHWSSAHVFFDDGMTGLVNIGDPTSRADIYRGIDLAVKTHFHGERPDIFFVEGMYGMTTKPLASEECANEFYRFNSDMLNRYGSSIWYSSHTKKIQRDDKGQQLEPDWFGSQMLLANVTAAFLFERLPMEHKSRLKQKKDTVSGIADELIFTFDPETFLMRLDATSELVSSREKFRAFLNACLREGKTFTYADLGRVAKVSQSTITRAIATWVADNAIVNTNEVGKKGIYKVLKLV